MRAKTFAFEAVVLWGENAAVREVAEAAGLTRVHLELASFRAPFVPALMMDPEGTNGAASTKRLNLDALAPEPPATEALLQSVHPGGDPQIMERARDIQTALVPLQLSDDVNIMLYSRYDGPGDFLEDVLPPLLEAGFAVQLKPHLGAAVRGGEVWAAQDRALAPWRGQARIEILPETEPPEALPPRLAAADLVVGLNSSVLFETTLLGGIAVPMGEACFAPPGAYPTLHDAIAHHADPGWQKAWQTRARRVAAALLSCTFVPDIDMVPALIRRLELWREVEARDPHASLAALERTCWPDSERLS